MPLLSWGGLEGCCLFAGAAFAIQKPLLFRGGVGVGVVPTRQGSVRRTAPTPLRLGSRLPSLRNPSPEEEGRL